MDIRVATRALALVAALGATTSAGPAKVPPAIEALLGRPVAARKLPGLTGDKAREALAVLSRTFDIDAGRVPVYVVSDDELSRVSSILSHRAGYDARLRGLEYRGVVYVADNYGGVAETFTHELLHAMSERFSNEAGHRGHHLLVEGTTQYFTLMTDVGKRAGGRRGGSAYGMGLRFAERLADIIGDEALAWCYFEGGFQALEREVDERLGKGRLARALAHLKQEDLGAAFHALGAEATHPFDGVFTN